MNDEPDANVPPKPLAGQCAHRWVAQPGPYFVSEVCALCKLYRYKSTATADWEYRAPIPFGKPIFE